MTGLTINKLVFNDGTQIDLTPEDIVVFVGPNNMGKSQSLRDVFNSISFEHGCVVVKDVGIEYHNPQGLKDAIESFSLTELVGRFFIHKGYNYQIPGAVIDDFGKSRFVEENIKKFLVSKVNTEDRLTTSSQKPMVDPGEPRQYPLQYIENPENLKTVSDIFEKIFSKKIYCEDRGSKMLTLHMGDEIDFEKATMTAQQIVDEYFRRMKNLPAVHEQGDGIRSLVGLLLNLMMPNYTIFLLDEPEAFLHPPQARVLGENLPILLDKKQSFISTHSLELIKGLLTKTPKRVKLIRITREGNLNHIHCLKADELHQVWDDPIIRHSNILDGLFYSHTVLCESDSDCQLYAAMMGNIKDEQGSFSDTLFTLCGGKSRMKPLSKIMKLLGIDFRIVPDIDFFNDEGLVKSVFERCGGNWAEIKGDYHIIYDAMNQPDGTLSREGFLVEVNKIIEKRGWLEMTKPYINRLAKDLPLVLGNQWDKLKHGGIAAITDVGVKAAAERLILAMNRVGVFPVRVGELESFFPEIESHGPGFAVSVLEKYPNMNSKVYDGLRDFVSSWQIN